MKAISITAMIFAVAAAFAVGWLTGSHAGYTAGAESEYVRIEGTGTTHLIRRLGFFVFSPPVAGTKGESNQCNLSPLDRLSVRGMYYFRMAVPEDLRPAMDQ